MAVTVSEAIEDAPESSARAAGLRYVSDREPGFTRRRRGKGFQYTDADGKSLPSEQVKRIEALAIPPAWTDVWICRSANGHLQATGRDARGRKQYRYHPRWREVRDETKYHRMLAFGAALPRIRRRVEKDMSGRSLSRERVVATVVHLLDTTNIRVGNDEYARENNSFGLTTIRERHVEVQGSHITFRFRGKSGKMHEVELTDPRAARVLKRCQELPGQDLFQYVDEDGEVVDIDSDDVNSYLQEVTETTSRPRISAPGQAPCSRPGRCRSLASSDRTPRRSGRWWRPWNRSRPSSETRPRSVAAATFIPRCSTPTWTAASATYSRRRQPESCQRTLTG